MTLYSAKIIKIHCKPHPHPHSRPGQAGNKFSLAREYAHTLSSTISGLHILCNLYKMPN